MTYSNGWVNKAAMVAARKYEQRDNVVESSRQSRRRMGKFWDEFNASLEVEEILLQISEVIT